MNKTPIYKIRGEKPTEHELTFLFSFLGLLWGIEVHGIVNPMKVWRFLPEPEVDVIGGICMTEDGAQSLFEAIRDRGMNYVRPILIAQARLQNPDNKLPIVIPTEIFQ